MMGRGRNRNGGFQPVRMMHRPLKRLHTPHGAAGHTQQAVYAQVIDQPDLGAHHVPNGHDRETHAVRFGGRRVGV